jgi:GNAT superfamily N-acetyltransferase
MKYIGLFGKSVGEMVSIAYLEIPLKDNLDKVYLTAYTHPKFRNLGHGTALLEKVEQYIRDLGRSVIWTETMWSVDGRYREGISFLENLGYTLDLTDAMRALDLPWQPRDPKTDPNYSLLTWRQKAPEQLIDEYARLRALITNEAPTGDLELENEFWDAARIRAEEKELTDLGRTISTTVAVAADGALAGHTQLIFDEDDEFAYQWDTLVLREHRGHGLGYSLKVQNLNETMDLSTGRTQVRSWNAEVNTHMIAINEAIGFRHLAYLGEYVKRL